MKQGNTQTNLEKKMVYTDFGLVLTLKRRMLPARVKEDYFKTICAFTVEALRKRGK